ncbi:AraC family transcriptional regulator [Vallitalea longa]|uniref:AraC family transcriptional regulator n=1 Tax=Vallitalea longa TaxID=2936439 RepID=A0A9W5YD51_9FIRM|nr:helix-turn-helix domain-containing protein [Vallitalea longa]GKX30416.1 AraC family transcriptional regulator [Vallitalea longa]
MDWLKRMNEVINYIEKNLNNEIDYSKIAKIACCPNYHFQRMFAFITEMPISEYIRYRRLTLAALELQNSKCSIIEIAQKYGYTSHSAFTRAFNDFHGVTPTSARKSGTQLKAYPRMSFDISIEGRLELNYRIEKRNSFSVVGYKYRVDTDKSFSIIPIIWQKIKQDGNSDRLLDLLDIDMDLQNSLAGVLGILSEGNWGNNSTFNYHVAVSYEGKTPVNMEKINFPECKWVVFNVLDLTGFADTWKRLYVDWMLNSNYSFADLPAIECYYPPGHNPQNEIWIPIKTIK